MTRETPLRSLFGMEWSEEDQTRYAKENEKTETMRKWLKSQWLCPDGHLITDLSGDDSGAVYIWCKDDCLYNITEV